MLDLPTKEMDEIMYKTGETVEYAKQYVDQQKQLIKLDVAEKSAQLISSAVTGVVLAVVGLLTLLFASLALAFFLGDVLDSIALGFLIVTIIYAVVALVVNSTKRKLVTNPVLSGVITKFFDDSNDSENNDA